jgi:hypothetical protein
VPYQVKISISRSLPVLIPPFFCLVQVVAERALKVLRSDEAESKQFLEEDLVTLNAEEEELGKDIFKGNFFIFFLLILIDSELFICV